MTDLDFKSALTVKAGHHGQTDAHKIRSPAALGDVDFDAVVVAALHQSVGNGVKLARIQQGRNAPVDRIRVIDGPDGDIELPADVVRRNFAGGLDVDKCNPHRVQCRIRPGPESGNVGCLT